MVAIHLNQKKKKKNYPKTIASCHVNIVKIKVEYIAFLKYFLIHQIYSTKIKSITTRI
jgi:hypothetical protein